MVHADAVQFRDRLCSSGTRELWTFCVAWINRCVMEREAHPGFCYTHSLALDHVVSSLEIRKRSVPIPKQERASSAVRPGSSGFTINALPLG